MTDSENRGVPLYVSDEEHARMAKSQREGLELIAQKLDEGAPLSRFEAGFAAAAIRQFASSIPLKKPRKRGQAPRFDHGSEALMYAVHIASGKSRVDALAEIADRVGLSEVAVEKGIKKHLAAAERVVRALRIPPEST